MAIVGVKLEGSRLFLCPNGRVDSNNADYVEKEISEAIANNPHESVTIDADNLQYISSAGLRDILRLRKNEPTLTIINASSEIYDIFEMTGFTEMIPVSKGYRKLSVDGCEVIGRGAKGTVYRWNPDTIVKVYNNSDSLPDINRERNLARRAFVLGIPTAIPYDVVRVNDKFGSVFELLNAKSFSALLLEDPDNFDKYVDEFAKMLRLIHSTPVNDEDMPDVRPRSHKWVNTSRGIVPDEVLDKIDKMISDVHDDRNMLHCDYHTNNIMMQNGEAILIDMDTLSHGNPVFELANIHAAFVGFSLYDHEVVKGFLGIPYEVSTRFYNEFLKKYLGTEDEAEIEKAQNKVLVLSYLRQIHHVARRGAEDETAKGRIQIAVDGLMAIIDKVDDLAI